MGCFNGLMGDNNWWWIIILILIAGNSCILDSIRGLVCGDNLIWIILLLLVCNGECGSTCGNVCAPTPTCNCGCC